MGNVQSDKVFLSTRLRCIEMLLAQGGVCFCTVWIELFPDGIAKAAYVQQKHHQRAKPLRAWSWGEKNFHKSQAAYWTFAHDCAHLPSCKLLWTQQMPIANAHQQLTHAQMCFPLWARRGKMQRLQESRLSRRHEASHSKAFPHATLVRPPMSWCRKPQWWTPL